MMSKYVIIDGKHISFLKEFFEPDITESKMFNFKYFAFDELPLCNLSEITNYIIDNQIDIKNGDVIVFCDPDILYRNAGRCIWYNNNAIHLSDECDEYGEVPKCFEITPTQYHPRYWNNTIAHNIHYWPCLEYRMQCCNNISDAKKTNKYTWFIHNDIKEYVVLGSETVISDEKFKELLSNVEKPYDGYFSGILFLEDMTYKNTSIIYNYRTE